MPPNLLLLFERIVNAVHHNTSRAAIAFNANPTDSLGAAKRWGVAKERQVDRRRLKSGKSAF